MNSAIFILVYYVLSFAAAIQNNIQVPKSSCSNGLIYDVKGTETLKFDDGLKTVYFECQVTVNTYDGYSDLRLLVINMTDSNNKRVDNPAGWELPIKIEEALGNITIQAYHTDTEPSREIKMAVLNLLPSNAFTETRNINLEQIQAAEDLIKEGDEKTEIKDDAKDLVLVMGNTGSGKTTLVQWLAGNRRKLFAKEVIAGLGEFIIEDDKHKISRSTIYSNTSLPELVFDSETGDVYYDLPGFSDTRNSTIDIVNSYFIKKILDHANSIKIIFTVNYPSVKEGVNRFDFMELLRHATQLINDIRKFEKSFILVVTKVDDIFDKTGYTNLFINDNKVISGIASFMKRCQHDLEQRLKNEQSNSNVIFYDKAIDLIKFLLHNENNEYKRICLFRRPSKAGTLADSDRLEKDRKHIKKIIQENIFFTLKDDTDFGHTLSDNTKSKFNELINAVDLSLLNYICGIADKIQVLILHSITDIYLRIDDYNSSKKDFHPKNITKIQMLLLELSNKYEVIKELESDIRNVNNISTLEIKMGKALNFFNISLPFVNNISIYTHCKEFLDEICETQTSISPVAWASSFHDMIVNLAVEQKRIQNIVTALSQYNNNIIKTKILQACNDLTSLFKNKEMKNNDVIFLRNEFTTFLKKIENTIKSSDKYINVQNIYRVLDILNSVNIYLQDDIVLKIFEENEYKELFMEVITRVIDYLDKSQRWYTFLLHLYRYFSQYAVQKNIINLNMFSKEIQSVSSNFIVQGSFVENFLVIHCPDLYQREYENIKDVTLDQIKLHHLHEIIMESIQKPEQLCTDDGKLIVKGHNVKLSDVPFMNCPKTVKVIQIFALNTFYIDYNLDMKGENVQLFVISPLWDIRNKSGISLDGYAGQNHNHSRAPDGYRDGKDGEDGKPGLPGAPAGEFFAIVQNFTNDNELVISVDGGDGGKGQNGGNGARGSEGTMPHITDPEKYLKDKGWYYNTYNSNQRHFLLYYEYDAIYGNNCTNGGDGGRGGHGGYGGYPGTITFILLTTQKAHSLRGKKGKMGPHGSVGVPGIAGSNGGYAIIDWFPLRLGKAMTVNYFELPNCTSGKVKRNGDVNDRGILMPQRPNFVKPFHVINDYKKYLRDNLENSAVASFMHSFLKMLETDTAIQNLYDANGFLEEMLSLETQFYKYHNKTEILLSSYKPLLNRINKYLSLTKYDSKNDSQDLNILNYLRIAIQSKTYKISYDLENYLVIGVKEYFNLVSKHIDNFGKSLKEVKIDEYRNSYESNIRFEIKKAKDVLIQKVMPEIDILYADIDQQIKILVKDIISRKYAAENKKDNVLKKLNELGKTILFKKCLKVLKMFSGVTEVFNFVTELASNTLGLHSNIDVKEGLMETQKKIENIYLLFENEKECLVENFNEFSTEDKFNNNDDLFYGIQKKIQPLLNLVNCGYEKYSDYLEKKDQVKKELNTHHTKLIDEINSLENKSFSKDPNTKAKLYEEVSLEIDKLKDVEKNIRISEVCCQNRNINNDEVSALGGEIEKLTYQIDVLNFFEKLIYDSVPHLKAQLEYNLYKMGLSTVNASHAEIDFNNMKIRSIIQDFKNRMNFMTQITNNEIKIKIKSCIDNLQIAMLTVIKINDLINDYYDKLKFTNYIADLISDDETEITDRHDLNNEVHKLRVIAQSNVILQEYEKALMAFRQYMFPFVGLYLEQVLLENQATNTIENLVRNAIKTIDFFADELTKEASVIKKKTYRIYPDIRFDNLEFEQPPFIVFAREDHEKEISNLLKGEDIILTANISKGLSKNAIKFREIGIRIVAMNKSVQAALDHELSQYLIELTHSGDSYYRCDNMIYVINHNEISLKHSVQRDDRGMYYYHLDHTSTLIRNNPPMCSPYTTWKVKLVNKNDDITNLSAYENVIKELALEGWGQYVELGLDVCNENLSKFYDVVGYFNESISLTQDNF